MSAVREVVYGRNPVREALRGKRAVHRVWVSVRESGGELSSLVEAWTGETGENSPCLEHAGVDELTQKAGSSDHQGLVAEVDPYPCADPNSLLDAGGLVIALDRVQDPHNLGAVIRTANAAGATENTLVAVARNLSDFLIEAREYGFWSYGAESGGGSYLKQEYPQRCLLVVGSEGKGLGDRVRQECDVLVGVPMAGKIESLNVGVSAAVLMFEVRRQWGWEEGR